MEKGEKIYLVYLKSNNDGEAWFSAIPCSSLEKAKEIMKEEIYWVFEKSNHFGGLTRKKVEDNDDYIYEEDDMHFCLKDVKNSYYEDYNIKERTIE